MTLGQAVRTATAELAAAGVESPALDARVLASEAFGLSPARLLAGSEPAPEHGLTTLARLVARRVAGEPVSRILGRREFWGLDFALTPETLTPRPDTETIVETALELLPKEGSPVSILDLGTGSGCILLALLSALPDATGLGVDLSPGAAAAARANAEALGLEGRASFVGGRWAEAIDRRFDLVVSNPPYIESAIIAGLDPEVRLHDPMLALDGGADGLEAYRTIVADLSRLLAPDGLCVLELGVGQGAAVSEIAGAAGLAIAALRDDLSGNARALALRRPPASTK
ncbi:peptide chain release factor N(5)-glutamine methyltransferase [Methylopila sp. M107]|uniref:peptide chain release factor N(5)-glutamine methyltransferase n=1 Tax=Methylopila sp. M107 TaxID=1101190 RepID=UPI00037323BA|nr:peptide chain release factor N(5)-glutamine methyltransferase [Methylopila sp. M107]